MEYSNHSLHVRKHEKWKHISRAHLNGHYQRHNAKNPKETTDYIKRKEKKNQKLRFLSRNFRVQYCFIVWQGKGLINKIQIRAWHEERAVARKEKGNYKANRRSSNSNVEVLTICLEQYSREEKKMQLIKANF